MARKPDIQKLLAAHVSAKEQAERWATAGIEHVKAGRIDEAKAAQRRAQIWVERMTAIEAKMRKAK